MKANESKLDKFLSNVETIFAIPVYQRNYDWNAIQCQQLLKDILEAGSNDDAPPHFIGSIVYVHDDVYTATGPNELSIIDGQQRLTTVTLIYIAIYWLAKEKGITQLADKIYKTYLINEFAEETEKIKLKPTENNSEALKHLLNGHEPDSFKGYSKIIENYKFFKSKISDSNYEAVWRGLSKLIFIDIALDRQNDSPQRIFESLNSTGLELSQADLIRNYILMGLSRKKQDLIYKTYWEIIEKNAKNETDNQTKVSDFIRDYLTATKKAIPNKAHVYTTYKNAYPTGAPADLERQLSELKSLSALYNKLLNPENESDPEIKKQLRNISRLEVNVAFPFLMKVYDDYSKKIITKETFISVLSLIQSFIFRRFIVGLPTNALSQIFMTLYDKINPKDYIKSIQSALLSRGGKHRFPSDAEVKKALIEKDVYNTNLKYRSFLFEKLENFQNNEPVIIDGNPNITIEHIFPQNPDLQWETELGEEEYNSIKENYLNTIGNLTLSGNNGKLGNKCFSEKKVMNEGRGEQGYRYSHLWLNRDLKELDGWNLSEIQKRADKIAERCLQIWPRPAQDLPESSNAGEVNIFDADDPTGKSIEFANFFGEKIQPQNAADLYVSVIRRLFEQEPESFLNTGLAKKLRITPDSSEFNNLAYAKLDDTYYIFTNLSNADKFAKITLVLTELNYEDELTIKYAD